METDPESAIRDEALTIIGRIDGDDALTVLRTLARADANIAAEIARVASEHLQDVDVEAVANRVYLDLDAICVETVWDQAGGTRYGYVSPREKAGELFEDELRPYRDRMEMYAELSMPREAGRYCKGILTGIHRFEDESTSTYKERAVDVPRECFIRVLDQWEDLCEQWEDRPDVEAYVETNFPEWS